MLHFYSCTGIFYSIDHNLRANLQEAPYDAIIVPGLPVSVPGQPWNPLLGLRMGWAKKLYDEGLARNIIFSGAAVYTPYNEATIMAEYARKSGIDSLHIFEESTAEHSTENVYYSFVKLRRMGFKRIALATDFVQGTQLRWFINRYDLPIAVLTPTIFEARKIRISEPEINKNIGQVKGPFTPLPQRESFWERFQGTMGKRIKWLPQDKP